VSRVILSLQPPSVHGGSQTEPDAADIAFEQINALLREPAAHDPIHAATVNVAVRVCPSGLPRPYVVDGHGTMSDLRAAIRPDSVH
jgi:hypothetical protein